MNQFAAFNVERLDYLALKSYRVMLIKFVSLTTLIKENFQNQPSMWC